MMRQIFFLTAILILGVASRLLPHPANFTPLGAIALFSGYHFKNRNYALLPLIALAASDLFISGYYGAVMFYVYGSFFLTFLLGRFFVRQERLLVSGVAAATVSAILFFLITNFAVWLHGTLYARDLSGLLSSYIAALPFFRNSLLGDLTYSFTFLTALKLSHRPLSTVSNLIQPKS